MKKYHLTLKKINHDRDRYIEIIKKAEFTLGRRGRTRKANIEYWFQSLIEQLKKLKRDKGKLFFIGNGASCSIASHFAADFTKRAEIPSFSVNDGSLLTCFSNDISFENAYAEILKKKMAKGDGLIAVSSSGRSRNILKAAEFVRRNHKSGLLVTLSAFKRDNPLRRKGVYNIYLPARDYGCAESGHAYYLHLLLDLFIEFKKVRTTRK